MKSFRFGILVVVCLGVVRTSSAQLLPPSPKSPSDGAVDQPTTVTLAWSAELLATSYDLQVSTDPNFQTSVSTTTGITGTSQQVGPLSNSTTYYWRVRSVTLLLTSGWSGAVHFATVAATPPPPPRPATPTLSSPQDGTTGLSTSPVLTWNASSGAASYRLQVSTSSSFNSLVTDLSGLSSTSQQVSGLSEGTQYYWRVNASNSSGTSGWSGVWNFTTTAPPPPPSPPIPVLASPADGTTGVSTAPTLAWNASTGATAYRLEVSTVTTFSSLIVYDSTLTGVSKQLMGLNQGTQYYWRVNASNAAGTSDWSAVWSFATATPVPKAPVLADPPDGATGLPATLLLRWKSVPGANSYHCYVMSVASHDTTVIESSTTADTSKQIDAPPGTECFWRVSAESPGGIGSWSLFWTFTTALSTPGAPVLASPADGATNQPDTLVFMWRAVAGATTYDFDIARTSALDSLVANDTTLTDTTASAQLVTGTQYFWRVRARNAGGTGPWSAVRSFSTKSLRVGTPVLLSPPDSAGGEPASLYLSWAPVPGARSYDLQVSMVDTFSTLVTNEVGLHDTVMNVSGLTPDTVYFWRTRAEDSKTTGDWSPVWRFKTAAASGTGTLALHDTIVFPEHADPSQYRQADYRLIGLPGASNAPIAQFLPGSPGVDWQVYWDNGAPTDYTVPYKAGPEFVFSAGRAYWMIKRTPWIVDANVPVAPLDSASNASIPLHEGWNIITNPFPRSIPWSSVQSVDSVNELAYAFKNGVYTPSDSLQPYEGYYFFNASHRASLLVPSATDSLFSRPRTMPTVISSFDGWIVNVRASGAGVVDSALWFGDQSGNGIPKSNIHKPRSSHALLSTWFQHPEWDSQYPAFASDMLRPAAGLQTWNFTVLASAGHSVRLEFLGIDAVPKELEVYLLDHDAGTATDLRNAPLYDFVALHPTTDLTVLTGSREDVQEQLKNFNGPRTAMLGRNYPNPFNPSTFIPFEVPGSMHVTIAVFNLIGQKIRTLLDETVSGGWHVVSWNGSTDAGVPAASGVYFCRMETRAGTRLTTRMILAK